MKKLTTLVLLFAVTASFTLAQEEPIPPPRRATAPKVGLFGGFTPAWLKVNVAPVNEFLLGAKGGALEDNGMMMYGGAGAIYIMVVKNLRVGGVGMGGAKSSTAIDAAGVRRDAEMSVSFGGLTLEYVFPIVPRFDVAVGTMIGGGGTTLTLRQNTGGNATWADEQRLFGTWPWSGQTNSTRRLEGSFFTLVPSVNVEYAILGYLGVRLGASYVLMFAPSWEVDGKHELAGVPSGVKGNGFMINAGILFGTF